MQFYTKSIVLSISFLLFCISYTFSQEVNETKALEIINRLIKENEVSKGFHSLDLFALKTMGAKEKIHADKTNIYCELEINKNGKKKDLIFAHKDIKKMVILKGEKAKYGASYVDDFQILIHYKQMGKLVIVGIDTENLESFIEAIQIIAPSIKKVTYAK